MREKQIELEQRQTEKKYGKFKMITMAAIVAFICSLYILNYSEKYNIISQGLFALSLALTMLKLLVNTHCFYKDYTFYAFVFMVVYNFISSFWVVCGTGVSEFLQTFTLLSLFYFVLRVNINSEKDFRVILWAVIVGTLIMCFYTILFYGPARILSAFVTAERIGSEVNQANGMGAYCAMAAVIMIYFIAMEKKKLLIPFLLIDLLILFATGSRRAIMIIIVCSVVFLVMYKKKGRVRRFLLLVCAVLILYQIIQMLAPSNYFFYRLAQSLQIFGDDSEALTDGSLITRMSFYELAFKLFLKKPIFGHGPVQFEYYYYMLYGLRRPPHSTYMQILVGYGALGFSVFYGMYVYLTVKAYKAVKALRKYAVLILSLMILLIVNDFAANYLTNKCLYLFLGLCASYFTIDIKEDDTQLKNTKTE